MTPKISIIVPAFNEEKFISRCLDSILNQNFKDFEVLCIDDGSTDSTFDIITKYSQADSRIVPFKNTGKGVSSARNLGLDNAKGEYIGFVDSDDFIQPQMYDFLYKSLTENNGDMAICGCKRTGVQNVESFVYSCKKCSASELIEENKIDSFLCIWTKLIKKDVLKNEIRFKKFKIGEDSLFCSDLWVNSSNVLFVDLPLYNYFTNPNGVFRSSLSNEKWLDQIKTHFFAYKNFLNYLEKYPSVWFLENGIKFLLSYRLFSKKNKNKNNETEIKKLYSLYFSEYKNCSDISTANKIYVFISYHFPLIYEIRRKLLDKTIR